MTMLLYLEAAVYCITYMYIYVFYSMGPKISNRHTSKSDIHVYKAYCL